MFGCGVCHSSSNHATKLVALRRWSRSPAVRLSNRQLKTDTAHPRYPTLHPPFLGKIFVRVFCFLFTSSPMSKLGSSLSKPKPKCRRKKGNREISKEAEATKTLRARRASPAISREVVKAKGGRTSSRAGRSVIEISRHPPAATRRLHYRRAPREPLWAMSSRLLR